MSSQSLIEKEKNKRDLPSLAKSTGAVFMQTLVIANIGEVIQASRGCQVPAPAVQGKRAEVCLVADAEV